MQTITRGKLCTSALIFLLVAGVAHAEWKVDFSRRQQLSRQQDLRAPASAGELPVSTDSPAPAPAAQAESQPGFFQSLFESADLGGEIVVLNTDKGFVPSSIRVKKGSAYKIHVVNVNEKEKNVSFVLDSFSEHHATFYGKIKTFVIKPQKEGVYRFVSPETSAQGKLVVYPGQPEGRAPASAE